MEKMKDNQDAQIAAVQEIVELLYFGPQIAILTCLVPSFNQFSTCARHHNKDVPAFLLVFHTYAGDKLTYARVSAKSEEKNIDIDIFNNSN